MTVAQLVTRERARLSAAILARGAAAALAIAALIVAGSAVALGHARWITLPAVPLLGWSTALTLAALALWWTNRVLHEQASHARVAEAIERERALRAGALRGALEVASTGALGRRAADTLATRLTADRGPLAPALQRRNRGRGLLALAAAAGALGTLGAARAAFPDGWRAMRHPVRAYTGSLLAPIRFVDPPAAVLRGEQLHITIVAPARRRLTLAARTTGKPWRTDSLPVVDGSAATTLGPVDADLILVASDGRSASDTLLVRVTDRPFVGDVAIRARYPSYLRRAAEVVPTGERLRLPQGTMLGIRGRASTVLARIAITHARDTLRLTPDGHTFGGTVAAQSGVWSWVAAGVHGSIADVPPPLDIEVIPDSAPRVDIVAPSADTVVLAAEVVTLRLAATDDHGLASVSLRSWRRTSDGHGLPVVTQELATPDGAQWAGTVPLDLAPRQLEPGDELHVVASATDASPWRQIGTSRELVLRVPSLEAQRQLARALADSATAHATAAAKAEKRLEETTGDASRARQRRVQTGSRAGDQPRGDPRARSAEAMSYEASEQTRSLANQQQQIEQQVRSLQREAKHLEQQLRAAGALDTALMRQLRDVQQLLAEALTPELQAQLQKLQAAARMSPDEARHTLAELAEQQRRLREQLERSAEMLKRAALEGAMQTLRDDAHELAGKERALADSISPHPSPEPRPARGDSADAVHARHADELGQRSRNLSRDIKQLAERLQKDKAASAPAKLQQAAVNAQRSADAMRRSAEAESERPTRDAAPPREQRGANQPEASRRTDQQRAGDQGPSPGRDTAAGPNAERQQSGQTGGQRASEAAQEGAEQMEAAARQLSDARQSQISEWKNELTGELDRSIQEMLQLAREQQALADRARAAEQPQQLRGGQSAVQQGAERVAERVQRAAGKSAHVSPQAQGAVGDAQRKVTEATQQLAEGRRASDAMEAMDQAAQALTKAAAAVVKDRERAASAQSASGFAEMLQRMQEAAKRQGQLNAQAAGILPLPGAQASEQARALGGQQRALAKQLERIGDGDPTGRIQALAKEMKDIADQLERGKLDPNVIDRQQRLFHRLLDAGLSLAKDEREDQGERESRPATGSEGVVAPPATVTARAALRYREPTWNELRGLTADERRAVLEYFKRINAEQEGTRPHAGPDAPQP